MRPADVAAAFVARINEHDVIRLAELMTDDHVFIDPMGNRTVGREAMRTGWEQYFGLVPDYWIKVDRVLEDERVVGMFGAAGGTYAGGGVEGAKGQWEIPAAWLAEMRGGQVALWRVYADNWPMRRLMNLERE